MEIRSATLSVDFSSIHTADPEDMTSQKEEPPIHCEEPVSPAYRDSLAQVRHLISAIFPDSDVGYTDYSQVLDRLCHCYDVVFGGTSQLPESQLWPQIFGWLYTLPDLFLSDAQQRRPVALVVFAFFTVLLKRLDPAWFIRGWPEHVINSIYNNLDEHHREYVQWPVEQIGRLSDSLPLSRIDAP
ncbi:hypothetical protein Aspvir_004967 [Aspergillus viridinutans]|uniref:Uncharacterized protein n=1 Tax=Aspergillus viridinutans TaxID=75553 RepID=A0A9P3BRZ9_ASPVI|nr:uncharacterized protein Aspvir_004967 [Aspergillus viridinutans]GIK00937.1 hypothetical protein Aspvir_004967 [Aspergillus viridinutans]